MPARTMTTEERFMAAVEKQPGEDGCWLWRLSVSRRGYGRFNRGDRTIVMAHRWAFEHFVGPVPDGLVLDHLCITPRCVRPSHLDPCTLRENTDRWHDARGECDKGHPRELMSRGRCTECSRIKERARTIRRNQARKNGTVDLSRITHGTVSAYTSYGCRCEACRAEMARRGREYRARKAQAS